MERRGGGNAPKTPSDERVRQTVAHRSAKARCLIRDESMLELTDMPPRLWAAERPTLFLCTRCPVAGRLSRQGTVGPSNVLGKSMTFWGFSDIQIVNYLVTI